jgi:uncharacterized protein (DUF1501 family)
MSTPENPVLHTRREFLRHSLLGGALSLTVPSFLLHTMNRLHGEAVDSAVQTVTGRDGPILVVLQLAGGNDGLNTVVPFANDLYYKARPRLAVAAESVLKVNDRAGFHPALAALKGWYDEGRMTVVEGTGYPNPNRSHFRSTEIWHTASDADRVERHGWIGRYFDNACAGEDALAGVALGKQMPQAFTAKTPRGVTFENPARYQFPKEAALSEQAMMLHGGEEGEASGASIADLGGAAPVSGVEALDFLERTHLDAEVSSRQILELSKKGKNEAVYPNSALAQKLSTIARFISGGLKTRIYYLSQGGYDTHQNQLGSHERLLREFSEAMAAFLADLKAQGNDRRVTVLTFSEFGRRVKENGSQGTDHGAAAPLFLFGGPWKGGMHGQLPTLAEDDLVQGDIRYHVDFRSVYATVLQKHLGTAAAPVLGRDFPVLDLA